ncbi:flavin-containing monooxygenase FMO GS-OX4-like [Lingula anatina]|uniref:Flavin-containing monooxygenase n=1 Tax=Lingula anatina TaxID=7574 RepID=A0A1S3JK26_LINAN|nr:flavin-containing monooxygenase FMO GS-OX4-like [Lingula anatina]|eukprot:XP_013410775.1 flavin-containing monooxygenase FMO GS-OX4-like [Lingula anatina]
MSVAKEVIRVAVIGAGAAGLVALRHLSSQTETFQAFGFEQTGVVGGTWVYNENTGSDEYGLPIHSSMYRDLRTNLPKEVMAFPDFPFEKDGPSFITHQAVRKYLEDYAEHFKLKPLIKFFTEVESVKPVQGQHGEQVWQIQYKDVRVKDSLVETLETDAVIVCNGHYSVPVIPDFPGMEKFSGQVLHSHDYRYPEPFKDKVVCCLGAGASGQDIMLELAKTAKQVILSHNKAPLKSDLPANIHQASGIDAMTETGAVMKDGEECHFDVLILCTGYHYTFPFLSPECSLNIEDERVIPLYKHIIHTECPRLSFIGICKQICPFPQFHNQVKFVLKTLDGSLKLPTKEEMDADIKQDFEWRLGQGFPKRHAHTMGPMQWQYNDELADIGQFEHIPKVVEQLYQDVHKVRVTQLQHYKKCNYRLTGPDSYIEV